jgi:CRISPR-associated protein Cmr6
MAQEIRQRFPYDGRHAMTTPLYRGAEAGAKEAFKPKNGPSGTAWSGNAGLWYDKFCDRWHPEFDRLSDDDAKRQWVESVVRPRGEVGTPDGKKPSVKTGDAALLAEHARRRRSLVLRRGGRILDMKLETRFVTGLGRNHPVENGFAWHHVLGVPYLAGSGVKGLVRAWAASESREAALDAFGPPPKPGNLRVGKIILLDALPVHPVSLVAEVMTPHYGPWNLSDPDSAFNDPPADWHSPTPIPFLALEASAEFQFAMLPRVPDAPLDAATDWLTDALAWLGAGAKTAIGFGRFAPVAAPRSADPESPSAASAMKAGKRSAGAATSSRLATVDGQPVEILDREGDLVTVQFIKSRDIETVRADEIAE